MGIRVECPHGHVFKVKDKYAGKKGLCPHCVGQQVVIRVPDVLTDENTNKAVRQAFVEEHRAAHPAHPTPSDSSSSVLDDSVHADASSSGSLLGSSVIRHNVKCECGEAVPMWFAKCPKCGKFLNSR